MNTIAYVAGKSGGHIIPCLTLASRYKEQHPDARILFFSTHYPLDAKLVTGQPAVDIHISHTLHSINYRNPLNYLRASWQLTRALINSLRMLRVHQISQIISTGGYNAIPVCLAARLLRIPVQLWELNVEPGSAIRLLAPLAHTINICFAQTQDYLKKYHCTVRAYPVRYTAADKQPATQARATLGLDPQRFTLFILGGSQGSQSLNEIIKKILEHDKNLKHNIQCVHQTGSRDLYNLKTWYTQQHIPAVVFDYRDDVATLFNAADQVITRAGAGALFELAFFEKHCLIFPLYAATTSHQVLNARAFAQQYPQLARVIEPANQQDWAAIAPLIHQVLSDK